MKPIKIIEIGAEGGRITLVGWKTDQGQWHFFRETDERTLMGMMPENDFSGSEFQSNSEAVTGWDEALQILSKYPWQHLHPLYVHPEFIDLVWNEIEMMEEECYSLSNWEAVCGIRPLSN